MTSPNQCVGDVETTNAPLAVSIRANEATILPDLAPSGRASSRHKSPTKPDGSVGSTLPSSSVAPAIRRSGPPDRSSQAQFSMRRWRSSRRAGRVQDAPCGGTGRRWNRVVAVELKPNANQCELGALLLFHSSTGNDDFNLVAMSVPAASRSARRASSFFQAPQCRNRC